jgi:hypothetical protein
MKFSLKSKTYESIPKGIAPYVYRDGGYWKGYKTI